ncbi:DUF2934 domain-containing protein [Bradyrhizobium sp. USDA 4463]
MRRRGGHKSGRPYELWEQSGCPSGRDWDFWLQAERKIVDKFSRDDHTR